MRNGILYAVALMFAGSHLLVGAPPSLPPPPPGAAQAEIEKAETEGKNPMVEIRTSMGTIKAELWKDKAPQTVANFMDYARDGFYDGLIFHRVIDKFMIQGGGFTQEMKQKETKSPVKNEASGDALNKRGTLAMARTMVVDSATSQFFINLVDNAFLDHKNKSPQGFGYCVFGKVTEGMDVVDKIAKVKTGRAGPHENVPLDPVVIESIKIPGE